MKSPYSKFLFSLHQRKSILKLKDIIKDTNEKKIPYLLCEIGYDQKAPLENYFKEFNVESYSFYKDYESFDRGFTLKFKK